MGFEGSGTVVSEGDLKGKQVAFMANMRSGSFAEYCCADKRMVLPLDTLNLSLQQASTSMVNPLTVVAMLDIASHHNVHTVVNTAASSQLGRMMVRYFKEHGVKIINLVKD